MDDSSHHDDEAGSDNEESDDSDNDADDDDDSDDDSGGADDDASESLDEEEEATPPSINIPDETISSPSTQRDVATQATSTPSEITGVDESTETAGVVQPEASENAGVDRESEQDRVRREMDDRYGPREHSIDLRDESQEITIICLTTNTPSSRLMNN